MTENYGSPVDERAQAVHSEYFAKAVACDREYNIYNEDAMTGPMCRTIGGRGDVIGMAFGAVGEASSSVLVHAKARRPSFARASTEASRAPNSYCSTVRPSTGRTTRA